MGSLPYSLPPPLPLSPPPPPLSLCLSVCLSLSVQRPSPPPLSLSLSLCAHAWGRGGGGVDRGRGPSLLFNVGTVQRIRGRGEGADNGYVRTPQDWQKCCPHPCMNKQPLSVCLSVCLSACLSVCLSVCLSRYCPPPIHLYLILHPSSLPSLCPYYFLLALSVSYFLYLFPVLPRGLLSFPLSLSETTALWMLRFFACLKPQQRPTSVNGFTQWNKAEINGISTLSNLAPELSLHATWHTTCCTW